MRGIKITYFELLDLDIEANEKEQDKENSIILRRLNSVLSKIKSEKTMIDKNNIKLSLNENGEVVYKSNIGICARCGNVLEKYSKYCKICGVKI